MKVTWNWKRFAFVQLMSTLLFLAAPVPTLAQNCRSRVKRMVIGSIGGAATGSLIGAIFGGGKGAIRGLEAGSGGGALISIPTPAACKKSSNLLPLQQGGQYNTSIAPAGAPRPKILDGPSVKVRKIVGVRNSAILVPLLMEDLPHLGYHIGPEKSGAPDYLLDIFVTEVQGANLIQGGGFFRPGWNQYGSSWEGMGLYQVSVVFLYPQTIEPDPSRTATLTVPVKKYESRDGNYFIANVNGYGQITVRTNYPTDAAAEAALKILFPKPAAK